MMNCSTVDLKAYALGEVESREKNVLEEHMRDCAGCREELERLDLTKAALSGLPQEEIPQRIAFISDAVFEPSWWQRIWRSGPVMGFASAVMLAAAILAHGTMRPAVVAAPSPVNVAAANPQTVQKQIDDRVQVAVGVAVAKAVSEIEQRQTSESLKLLDAAEKRMELRYRTQLVSAQETIRMYQQQAGRMLVAYNNSQSGQQQ
jgi:anti-sigma factor RsiW